METVIVYLIPALLAFWAVWALFRGVRWILWMGLHWGCGFICLWLLNLGTAILPINPVTVFTAGVLGLPGMVLLAFLTIL